MADNRISRTTVANVATNARVAPIVSAESPTKPWYKSAWIRKTAVVILGAAMGASCPLWPAPIQPICVAVATAISQLSFSEVASPDGGM